MTAKELLLKHRVFFNDEKSRRAETAMIEFAQYHVDQALNAASNNVGMMEDPNSYTGNTGSEWPPDIIIDIYSILNAYPKENVK